MDLRDYRQMLSDSSSNLNPFDMIEEEHHPWLPPAFPFCTPLPPSEEYSFRVYDSCSQGQLDDKRGCIVAADLKWRLDTQDRRCSALKLHTNHSDWSRPSPLLSASTSVLNTIERARMYARKQRQEIVTIWEWSKIEEYLDTHNIVDWERNIIKPEFEMHERLSLARQRDLYCPLEPTYSSLRP